MNALTPKHFDRLLSEERLALLAAELIKDEGEAATLDHLAVLLGLTLVTAYVSDSPGLVSNGVRNIPDENGLSSWSSQKGYSVQILTFFFEIQRQSPLFRSMQVCCLTSASCCSVGRRR
jgi:hypothetical protein